MIKLKIGEHSISYATVKKAKTFRREEELEKEINTLQNFIDLNGSQTADALSTLETKKRELEETIIVPPLAVYSYQQNYKDLSSVGTAVRALTSVEGVSRPCIPESSVWSYFRLR